MNLRRVLVVQPYGIGDLLFLTPVLRALRLVPSVERVDLLLGSRTEALVRGNPHVDSLRSIDKDLFHRRSGMENFREVALLTRELRAVHYDLMLDYSLRGEYAFWAAFFLGIPQRAGFAYKNRAFFHNIRVPLANGFETRHAAESCAALAEAAGIPVQDRFFEFYISEESRKLAREAVPGLKPGFVALSPGGGESWGRDAHFKRWPPCFFGEFLAKLQNVFPFGQAVVLGSEAESALVPEIEKAFGGPLVNLAGKVPLEVSAAVLEKAALFLGNDGGLFHMASALRIPAAGWYGPVDPAVYGPYPADGKAVAIFKKDLECRPCYRRFRYNSACEHRDCLQALRPEEAFAFLESSGFWKRLHHDAAYRHNVSK